MRTLQAIQSDTSLLFTKVNAMENRQWSQSQQPQDCLRAVDQFGRGELWAITPDVATGVTHALQSHMANYGDMVFQCDQRRPEHAICENHYLPTMPTGALWQTAFVALRQPSVQKELIKKGVPEHLLRQFMPNEELLQNITNGSQLTDSQGKSYTPEAARTWQIETKGIASFTADQLTALPLSLIHI